MATRRLRAFKRWMNHQGIECSDALALVEEQGGGVCVRALCDLKEGDLVATIPKKACLTIKTTGAWHLIQSEGLDGPLGLAVALMYERSLAQLSPWAGYLQLLPQHECLPLLWTLDEVDSLLRGTELHKTVKEDKALIYEDWNECILPLVTSSTLKLDPKYFGVEQYFAAKSLISSRSFQVDNFHGFGMVPLADLFNHETGAEHVHFTSVSSHCESDDDVMNNNDDVLFDDFDNDDNNNICDSSHDDQPLHSDPHLRTESLTTFVGKNCHGVSNLECSSTMVDDPIVLEMIVVKEAVAGSEVFNTYGSMGNAALLHRYGFTEPNNQYDIVNIDLELVLQWSLSLFSGRYSRARLSLWRRLDYSGCVTQNSEYFEISSDGEPQVELLILLYIMLLSEEAYHKLDFTLSTKSLSNILSRKGSLALGEISEMNKDLLLTRSVCKALLSLADIRESFYGSNSIEDDIEALKNCCCIKERKLYHSLMLRVSERRIIEKLRTYAASGARSFRNGKRVSVRKKLKRI